MLFPIRSNIWEEIHWVGMAEFGDLIYLEANCYEYTHLAALFQQTHNAMILKMHIYEVFSTDEAYITNYPLNGVEQCMFEKLIARADFLKDNIPNYLL
jgi:hypothetical protein